MADKPIDRMAALRFRMRGHDVLRVEALSDVVFGFALTLLVVSLEVPRTFDQLLDAMRGLPAFAITFLLLISVWSAHYHFFRRYGLHDRRTMVLNTTLLFTILFYVYPLKFLFSFAMQSLTAAPASLPAGTNASAIMIRPGQVRELMLIFGAGFTAVYVLFAMMFANAYRQRDVIGLNALEVFDTRADIAMRSILAATGIVAMAVALVLPAEKSGLSGWVYLSIPFSMQIYRRIARRKRRELEDRFIGTLEADSRDAGDVAATRKGP